jgi:transcriptional regulator with XRE-family HTH domain
MTLGERLKLVQQKSGLTLPDFGKKIGVSKESLINYQKDRTKPDSEILSTVCKIFKVNPAWLLLGEGEPFIQTEGEAKTPEAGKVVAIDAAVQLLREAEAETGITLNPAQRQSILPILRKALAEDRREVNKLIRSMFGGKGDEGSG